MPIHIIRSAPYAIITSLSPSMDSAEQLVVELILEAFPFGGKHDVAPALPSRDGWDRVAETASHHGLAPLLYTSLKRTGRLDQAPAGCVERLQMEHLHINVGNMVAYRELAQLLDCLASERIPTVLLKGSAVAMQLYPDVGLRPLKDLDLLIAESQVGAARKLLTGRGYSPLPEMIGGFEERFSTQQAYSRSGPNPAQVDLHWHPFVIGYYRKRIPVDWFWQHTSAIVVEGRVTRALAPEAQFIHLAAHYALHHHTERLIWLYDLALLIAAHRDDMKWDEVLTRLGAFELTRAVQSTTAQVKQRWGVSLPDEVVRGLQVLSSGPYERVLFSLASAGESQARVIMDGIDLPTNRARLRYWLRHMFPTASYMRTRYHISNSLLVPIYYLWRIAAGGYRSARALIGAAGPNLRSQGRKN